MLGEHLTSELYPWLAVSHSSCPLPLAFECLQLYWLGRLPTFVFFSSHEIKDFQSLGFTLNIRWSQSANLFVTSKHLLHLSTQVKGKFYLVHTYHMTWDCHPKGEANFNHLIPGIWAMFLHTCREMLKEWMNIPWFTNLTSLNVGSYWFF